MRMQKFTGVCVQKPAESRTVSENERVKISLSDDELSAFSY